MRHWTALLLWAVVVGCGDGRPPISATSRDDGSITLRIGSVDEGDYAFGEIRGVATHAGDMYVMQWPGPEIWRFDRNGARVGTIGGVGEGPGELTSAGRFGFKGDTLWVKDTRLSRVSFFEPVSGDLIRLVAFAQPGFSALTTGYGPGVPLADGTMFSEPGFRPHVAGQRKTRLPLLKVDETGAILDTLAWRGLEDSFARFSIAPGRMSVRLSPLSGAASFAVGPRGDRVYVADGLEAGEDPAFKVTAVSITGDTLWSRGYNRSRVALTPSHVEAIVVGVYAKSEYLHDDLTREQFSRAFIEGLDPPGQLPSVTALVVGTDGSIWIRHEDDPTQDWAMWTIFDENGEPIAEVTTPQGFVGLAASGTTLFGSEADKFGVQYLVRRDHEW